MITLEEKKSALDAIEQATGRLTPDLVVKTAKNPNHILHWCFNWNDAAAAHQHRLDTARDLISSVRVFIEHEDRIVTAISYCRDPRLPGNEQGYVKVSDLAKRQAEAQDFPA
jgi:hypothetical protein